MGRLAEEKPAYASQPRQGRPQVRFPLGEQTMTTPAARPRLMLKRPPPPTPEPDPAKAEASDCTPPQWRPGRSVVQLHAQLDELLVAVPAVFSAPVVRPLRIGAHRDLALLVRPGCGTRFRRWLARWVRQWEYLAAVAAEGAQRHALD